VGAREQVRLGGLRGLCAAAPDAASSKLPSRPSFAPLRYGVKPLLSGGCDGVHDRRSPAGHFRLAGHSPIVGCVSRSQVGESILFTPAPRVTSDPAPGRFAAARAARHACGMRMVLTVSFGAGRRRNDSDAA